MGNNVAKVHLDVQKCVGECPFCVGQTGHGSEYFCVKDLSSPGISVGDGSKIPDSCPFVLERIEKVLEQVSKSKINLPLKYIAKVEKIQNMNTLPSVKFGADHGYEHIKRVITIGEKFINDCSKWGLESSDSVQKDILLFKIAAWLHDSGLGYYDKVQLIDDVNCGDHASKSVMIATNYLKRNNCEAIDIDDDDCDVIVDAVRNHSDGKDVKTIVSAALIIADKLDATKQRVVKQRAVDPNTEQMLLVNKIELSFAGNKDKGIPSKVYLDYEVDEGFDEAFFKSLWPKGVLLPKKIMKEYFQLDLYLRVNGRLVPI